MPFKFLSHSQPCETSVHVSACETPTKRRLAHTFRCRSVNLKCVFELGFGGDAGRVFMLCHSLKCLVRTCQNRCLKVWSPPLHMASSCSRSLIRIKPAWFSISMTTLCLICLPFVLFSPYIFSPIFMTCLLSGKSGRSWEFSVVSVHVLGNGFVWTGTLWRSPQCWPSTSSAVYPLLSFQFRHHLMPSRRDLTNYKLSEIPWNYRYRLRCCLSSICHQWHWHRLPGVNIMWKGYNDIR